jgi:hypothetical protein
LKVVRFTTETPRHREILLKKMTLLRAVSRPALLCFRFRSFWVAQAFQACDFCMPNVIGFSR